MVTFSPSTYPLKGIKKKMNGRKEEEKGGRERGNKGEKTDLDSGFKNTYVCKPTILN